MDFCKRRQSCLVGKGLWRETRARSLHYDETGRQRSAFVKQLLQPAKFVYQLAVEYSDGFYGHSDRCQMLNSFESLLHVPDKADIAQSFGHDTPQGYCAHFISKKPECFASVEVVRVEYGRRTVFSCLPQCRVVGSSLH